MSTLPDTNSWSSGAILLAEDEPSMRRLVTDYLKKAGFSVIQAGDGKEALELFRGNSKIILAVLDVMMPECDGWTVCREIRRTGDTPVIMLTARGEEYDELFGFELGANDYISKPFRPKILVARIKALLANHRRSAGSTDSDYFFLDQKGRQLFIRGEAVELRPKEYELLEYLIINTGAALSRDQLLTAVWDYSYTGDMRTLDTHVKRLRAKLGEYSRRLTTLRGYGYRWEESR